MENSKKLSLDHLQLFTKYSSNTDSKNGKWSNLVFLILNLWEKSYHSDACESQESIVTLLFDSLMLVLLIILLQMLLSI